MVITGRDRLKDLLALEGICDYLIKPFDAEELFSRIEWNIKTITSQPKVEEKTENVQLKTHRTILLVDDDTDLVETLKIRFESEKYNVFIAYNGEEAIQVVNKQPPDCIVLDVMMPKMDGFSTLRQLNQVLNRKIPVIIMTGTKSIPEEEFRIEGARAFFRKPFEVSELVKQVGELFS